MQASDNTTARGSVAFTYPGFSYYMLARFFIVSSLEMQSVAVGWQVYDITKRPLDLGLVGLAQFLPGIFLFLVAGHLADRLDRRRIIARHLAERMRHHRVQALAVVGHDGRFRCQPLIPFCGPGNATEKRHQLRALGEPDVRVGGPFRVAQRRGDRMAVAPEPAAA